MKKFLVLFLIVIFSFSVFAEGSKEDSSKTWPTKSITVINGWNPGDGTDLACRAYAQALQNVTGQPVVVVNKPGASGSVGTLYASQQPKDGYSILFSAETPGTFQVMGVSDVAFEAFDGISMMCEDTKIIVVSKDSKYKTIQDLLSDIKTNPKLVKLAYSSAGASGHIQGLILQSLGYETSMTPFGGGIKGITAVLGGQVDFTFANGATIMGYVQSGDLIPLAVFSDKRSPAFPDVPAFTEIVPDSTKYLPFGFPYSVLVPRGTDPAIEAQIVEYTNKAIEEPVWKDFINSRPTYKTLYEYSGPEQVNAYWSRFMSIADWLLDDAGVTKHSPSEFGIERIK